MKPENILIFKDNKTYFIKLADFETSKPMNSTKVLSTVNIQGTIAWIAPEVFWEISCKNINKLSSLNQ